MEIKVQCQCGTKFKFDVEPVHGRMPMPVNCPECASDRTADANQFITQNAAALTAAVTHAVPVVRIVARQTSPVAVAQMASPGVSVAASAVAATAPIPT